MGPGSLVGPPVADSGVLLGCISFVGLAKTSWHRPAAFLGLFGLISALSSGEEPNPEPEQAVEANDDAVELAETTSTTEPVAVSTTQAATATTTAAPAVTTTLAEAAAPAVAVGSDHFS